MKKYQTLKAGDVRQKGDEVRRAKDPHFIGKGYDEPLLGSHDVFDWRPSALVGHAILQSDVIVAEFRRPVV